MPKYMVEASYTQAGLEGLLKDGGTGRKKAVEELCTSLHGHLESIHYAFGDTDAFVVIDMPDDEAVAAAMLRIAASGAVRTKTTKLLTVEQVDEAIGRQLAYRAPGAS